MNKKKLRLILKDLRLGGHRAFEEVEADNQDQNWISGAREVELHGLEYDVRCRHGQVQNLAGWRCWNGRSRKSEHGEVNVRPARRSKAQGQWLTTAESDKHSRTCQVRIRDERRGILSIIPDRGLAMRNRESMKGCSSYGHQSYNTIASSPARVALQRRAWARCCLALILRTLGTWSLLRSLKNRTMFVRFVCTLPYSDSLCVETYSQACHCILTS